MEGVTVPPSPYGPPLTAPLGYIAGYKDPDSGASYAIPQFGTDTLLFAFGLSNATAILNGMDELPIALMLPCSVVTDGTGAVQGMVFATEGRAAECASQINVTWSET
jgi:hypothetical protein